MKRNEVRKEAEARQLGKVHFQLNTAKNTGERFEAGYVFKGGEWVLFCKCQDEDEGFYLCNEFAV